VTMRGMPIDFDKILELEYTAYEHSQNFKEGIDECQIEYPLIEVETGYDEGTPFVEVTAEDPMDGTTYMDRYHLENVTREEAEEVMFEVWRDGMKELEIK